MPRPPKKPGRKPNGRKPGGRKPNGRRSPGGFRAGEGKPRRRPAMKRPPTASPQGAAPRDGERLQKVLAAAGVASRRECEQLIIEGRVQVDGEVVSELGAKVDRARQEIRVDGEPLPRPRLQYFAVHKPPGVVSTARDPAGRPRVIDLLPPGVGRMFNVGRLDMASEGLILVTNDGELANRLTHPSHGVEKVYEVQVAGAPEPDVLAQVKRGVHLAEGFVHAVDVRVKGRKKGSTLLEMVLDEGRNREIRRLLARLGHKVQRLVRVAVGPVRLGEMPRGAVRPLMPEEIRKLRAAAEGQPEGDRRAASSGRPPRTPGSLGHGRKTQRPIDAGAPPRKRKPQARGEEGQARRIIGDESAAPPKRPRPAEGRGGPPKRPGGPGRRPGGPSKRPGGPRKGFGRGPKRGGRP